MTDDLTGGYTNLDELTEVLDRSIVALEEAIDGTTARTPVTGEWAARAALCIRAARASAAATTAQASENRAKQMAQDAHNKRQLAAWVEKMAVHARDIQEAEGWRVAMVARVAQAEGRACEFCNDAPREHEDHCHICQYFRGHLCRSCNGLEVKGEGPEWDAWRDRCRDSTEIYKGRSYPHLSGTCPRTTAAA